MGGSLSNPLSRLNFIRAYGGQTNINAIPTRRPVILKKMLKQKRRRRSINGGRHQTLKDGGGYLHMTPPLVEYCLPLGSEVEPKKQKKVAGEESMLRPSAVRAEVRRGGVGGGGCHSRHVCAVAGSSMEKGA